MSDLTVTYLSAAVALVGLMAYAVLGGADFGGGVWDLLAAGPRRSAQRQTIAHAMGPVWEANHVWLVFVIVVLFTCFPRGYAPLFTALFVPMHLVLIGIIFRGVAFVFRGYGSEGPALRPSDWLRHRGLWGAIFGAASIISPLLLGASFGVATTGDVRIDAAGRVTLSDPLPWLAPYPIICGLLALLTCSYLAAVYLCVETEGELREDFRKRAILAGTVTAALAVITLLVARREAPWLFARLFSIEALPVLAIGAIVFAGSAYAVFGRRYRIARAFAAGQTILMLLGWGIAHRHYMVYPDLPLMDAHGPRQTSIFLLLALPVGSLVLVPALIVLFRVFKSRPSKDYPL